MPCILIFKVKWNVMWYGSPCIYVYYMVPPVYIYYITLYPNQTNSDWEQHHQGIKVRKVQNPQTFWPHFLNSCESLNLIYWFQRLIEAVTRENNNMKILGWACTVQGRKLSRIIQMNTPLKIKETKKQKHRNKMFL